MKLVLITIALLSLAFAGIAVKILLKKNGKFAGTCASNNPLINEEVSIINCPDPTTVTPLLTSLTEIVISELRSTAVKLTIIPNWSLGIVLI